MLTSIDFNPRTHKGGEGGCHTLLRFFFDNKTSAPDVFSSSSFIPRTHFETSLVMISYYGYGTR